LVSSSILPAAGRKRPTDARTPNTAKIEAAARLQIFLDRANFSAGKVDGTYNEFTWKALALYRESRREQPRRKPQLHSSFELGRRPSRDKNKTRR
jgi:hypothetical protein